MKRLSIEEIKSIHCFGDLNYYVKINKHNNIIPGNLIQVLGSDKQTYTLLVLEIYRRNEYEDFVLHTKAIVLGIKNQTSFYGVVNLTKENNYKKI